MNYISFKIGIKLVSEKYKNARNIVFKPFSASCGQLRKKVI